jgi:spore maturation protein CgeB
MKHGLDIAFFSSCLGSSYWTEASIYCRGVIRALARRGHRVTFYEPDTCLRRPRQDLPTLDWARVVVYEVDDEDGMIGALTEASNMDLVIKASGVGVFDELLDPAVVEMQRPGTLVTFWDVDAPATLERLERNPKDPLHELISEYDLILTRGGGKKVAQAYEALGARMCAQIHNAFDPETCYRVDPDPRFKADLGYLGHCLPGREARIEEFFLRPAAAMPDHRFLLGGAGWEGKSMTSNVNYVGDVYPEDYNAFNSTPRASLGDNRESATRYGSSPSTRVFEAVGAGACLITDAWEDTGLFLEPGSEVLVAHECDEVVERLRSLTPERAREIGQAALRRMLAEHTYERRAEQVELLLGAKRMVFVEIA